MLDLNYILEKFNDLPVTYKLSVCALTIFIISIFLLIKRMRGWHEESEKEEREIYERSRLEKERAEARKKIVETKITIFDDEVFKN